MRRLMMSLVFAALIFIPPVLSSVFATNVVVPAYADPWLAGMPDGSTASAPVSSVAPQNSPILVTGLNIIPGQRVHVSASGTVNLGGPFNYVPDGQQNITSHLAGAENGIAGLTGPAGSLIGVFLGSGQPSLSTPPASLDFSASSSLDATTYSPLLQQPFFMGDGLTSLGATQNFIVPTGATRLYLGVLDSYGYTDNSGTYSVSAVTVPEPSTLALGVGAIGLLGYVWRRRKRSA